MISTDAEIIGPWVCRKTGGTWVNGRGTAIGKIDGDKVKAGVLYEDFNGANVVCHIAGEGNWATRGYLFVIFHYPFEYLGVERITAPVSSSNKKSVDLVTRMGFSLESRLEQATPDGDLLLFRMFRDRCKFINGKYGQISIPTAAA